MYKLIACDLDGTLLQPGEAALRPELFVRINNLRNMGVEFVVASGRPYYELLEIFGPVASRLTYICCDGAVIVRDGHVLFELPLAEDAVQFFVKADSGCRLYGLRGMYAPSDFVQEKVYKICLKKSVIGKLQLPSSVYVGYDGDALSEVLSVGADKGIALTFLQKKLRMSSEECVAFGDNRNDVWMLRSVGRSYAMKNARYDLSEHAQNVTGNVIETIDELFFNKRPCL